MSVCPSQRYDEAQAWFRDGQIDTTDRNLMIDGLMKRFIPLFDET